MEPMEKPLVSVVIPAYRCAQTLRCAVDSALAQDVACEVLVVDDCSGDDLESVLASFQADSRVRLLKNESNLGAAQSRNRGVAAAKGRYIAFLDADDCWRPGKLAKQLRLLEQTGTVLCATAREMMTPEGTLTGHVIPVPERITYGDLLKQNCINCSSVLIRREAALEFPMKHDDSHEDYIMWLEVLRKYGAACAVNEPLLCYRMSSTGKSGSKWKSAKMTWKVYRYMGFGPVKSALCFCSYALNGVKKHYLSK